jgi:Ni,Fe-hydrogenase III component G
MDTEQALTSAENLLASWTVSKNRPELNRLDVVMEVNNLIPAVQALQDAKWGYLSAITAMDHPVIKEEGAPADVTDGTLEALYHFCQKSAIVTLRVSVPYSKPVLPTVCTIIPSATLYEREMMELFGIIVTDTPCADRLVISEDWPEGVYPLRKSFTGFDKVTTD